MRYADTQCSYTEIYDPQRYVFTGPCAFCSKEQSVIIPAPELYAYRTGILIQTAMPSLSADEREFLMSGICPECWNKTFSEDDGDMDQLIYGFSDDDFEDLDEKEEEIDYEAREESSWKEYLAEQDEDTN